VLLHSVTDALLGAAAMGDIGQMFPNTDEANRGRDSSDMLRIAADTVRAAGWQIGNLDCVVLMERPKLAPHRDAIRRRIAEILSLNVEQVGLKAKTGEGVGTIGREEAVEAMCVALLEQD
jgi:2-C-methyl-D-erythritol 2,4-cyclodiphosphate synthase